MKLKVLAASVVALGAVALVAPVAHASTTQPASGVTLSVSPLRVEIPASAGKTVTEHYTLSAGSSPLTIYCSAMPYTMNAKGQIAPSTMPKAVSGVTWVHLPKAFTLPAGASRTVTVSITEPSAMQPGQRYVGLMWTASPVKSDTITGTGAHVMGSVGTELILDAPGAQTHATTYALSAPGLTWGSSVSVTATAKNVGNSYVTLNGQNVMTGAQANHLNGMLLLAGTSQAQTIPIALHWGVNHLTYNGVSKTVIAVPGMLLALSGGFLLLILGIVIAARRTGRHKGTRARSTRARTYPSRP